MGKFLKIVMAIMMVFVLVACEDFELSLDAPKNVVINDGVVTWDAVEGAEEYIVFVGMQQYTVTTTTFNLESLNLGAGDHTVYVIAKAGEQLSLPSSNKMFSIENVNSTLLNQALLVLIDPSYTIGMEESDFDDEWEFRDYQRSLSLVQTFSQTAAEIGMDQTEALSMFTQVMNMGNGMDDVEDFSDIKFELDAFDFDMDPNDVAIMIYNLLLTSVDQVIIDANLSIDRDEAALLVVNTKLDGFRTSTGAALYTQLKSLTSSAFYADLDDLFALKYTVSEYDMLMQTITYSIAPNILFNWDDPYYLMDDEPYVALFHNILTNAKATNQISLLQSLVDDRYPLLFSPFEDIAMDVYDRDYYNDSISDAEDRIVNLNAFKAIWIAEDDLFKQAIADFVSYATLLYDSITPALIAALDTLPSGVFGIDELFIIKDEVLNILITTLPDVEAFGDMYEVLFTISAAFGDINATQYITHAPYLGEIDHSMIEIVLLYLDTVTKIDIENIMDITDGMIYEEEVFEEYWDWFTETYITYSYYEEKADPRKVLELSLYMLKHVDAFVTANQTKIDALDALLDDAEMQQLYVKFLEGFEAIASENIDHPDELEIIALVVDELIAAYVPLRDVIDLFDELGSDFVDQFISTDAALFFGILDLQDYLEPDQDMFIDIEFLIDLFVPYNTNFFAPMDLATITNVLRLIKIPAKVAAVQEGVLEADFDAAFTAVVGDAAQVIFNVMTIQQFFVAYATALDLDGLMYLNDWEQEFDVDLTITLVILLDSMLTTQVETLIFDTINLVFDDVLENSSMLLVTEMLVTDLNTSQAELIDLLEAKIADIRTARTYVTGVPTPEQIDFIMAIFNEELFNEEPIMN